MIRDNGNKRRLENRQNVIHAKIWKIHEMLTGGALGHGPPWAPKAPSYHECFYRENVVGGRRPNDDKSLFGPEGAQLHFPCKNIRDWRAPNNRKGRLRCPRVAMAQCPLSTPLLTSHESSRSQRELHFVHFPVCVCCNCL